MREYDDEAINLAVNIQLFRDKWGSPDLLRIHPLRVLHLPRSR